MRYAVLALALCFAIAPMEAKTHHNKTVKTSKARKAPKAHKAKQPAKHTRNHAN